MDTRSEGQSGNFLGELRNREGTHRLYAETADHTQREAQASDALTNGIASGRLTVKTVADPIYLTLCWSRVARSSNAPPYFPLA